MKTMTYIDKTSWPDGPWKQEPDKAHWIDEATGLDCLIVRVPHSGHLCGYVGVPEGHICFGVDDNNINGISVHGGLTFADKCHESPDGHGICHVPEPGRPEHVWWLGFDCAHLGDVSPARDSEFRDWNASYKRFRYVQGECASLALQLAELKAAQLAAI